MSLTDLNKKADVLRNGGKEKEAIPLYQQLAKEYDKQGDVFRSGSSLQMIGVCYKIAKDEKNSLKWLHTALDYFTKHGHTTGQGNVWRDIGVILEYVEKYDDARVALEKSSELLETSDDRGSYGVTIAKLGLLAMRQKQYQQAEELLQQALKITHDANHWFFEMTTLLHLAELSVLTDKLDESEDYLDRAVTMLDNPVEEGHLNRRAEMLALRALIEKRRGQNEKSSGLASQARGVIKGADPEVKKQFEGKWYFLELS